MHILNILTDSSLLPICKQSRSWWDGSSQQDILPMPVACLFVLLLAHRLNFITLIPAENLIILCYIILSVLMYI